MKVPDDWKTPPTAEELAQWRKDRPWWRDWLVVILTAPFGALAGVLLGHLMAGWAR